MQDAEITIKKIMAGYSDKINRLDLEVLISHAINKPREFVLAHPEYEIRKSQIAKLGSFIKRRMKHEPIAYITGHKEFYGLDFEVNKHTLIPRPETELIVDLAMHNLKRKMNENRAMGDGRYAICDIGTGSGNIIISIAEKLNEYGRLNPLLPGERVPDRADEGEGKSGIYDFIAVDISKNALKVAQKNAKKYGLDKKIKFLHGNLLEPMLNRCSIFHVPCSMIITANLPYLSDKIYKSSPKDVRKYEPESALYSENYGLAHYEKLMEQLRETLVACRLSLVAYIEISPEQRTRLDKMTEKYFREAEVNFHKDLAGKWRVCEIII